MIDIFQNISFQAKQRPSVIKKHPYVLSYNKGIMSTKLSLVVVSNPIMDGQ